MHFAALAVYSDMLFAQFAVDVLTLCGLCGPAHHAEHGALSPWLATRTCFLQFVVGVLTLRGRRGPAHHAVHGALLA